MLVDLHPTSISSLRRRRKEHVAAQLSVFLIIVAFTCETKGWFEFCGDDAIYTISQGDCPEGVLFVKPMPIRGCSVPQGETATARASIASVCKPELTVPTSNEIQFVDVGNDDSDGPSGPSYRETSCKTKCPLEFLSISGMNTRNPNDLVIMQENDNSDEADTNPPEIAENSILLNQTLRLFMYLSGNLVDENEGGPDMRIIDILRMTKKVLAKHCEDQYVSHEFLEEIERAFLFILREGGTKDLKDVSKDQYRSIKKVLDACISGADWVKAVHFQGRSCKTKTKIYKIAKMQEGGTQMTEDEYVPQAGSFKWGHTDFVVEAIWSMVDFAHAMCYSGYNLEVNSHHLYQRAMERLFTKPVLFRWQNPQKLKQEFYWNHMFGTNIKVAMRNLDAAVQASYLNSPFLDRLRPPWITMQTNTQLVAQPNQRKKRDVSLATSAWCLQTVEDKSKFMELLQANCK